MLCLAFGYRLFVSCLPASSVPALLVGSRLKDLEIEDLVSRLTIRLILLRRNALSISMGKDGSSAL